MIPAEPQDGRWIWTGSLELTDLRKIAFAYRADYGMDGDGRFSEAGRYADWTSAGGPVQPVPTAVTGMESRAETLWFEYPGETEAAEWRLDLKTLFENGGYGLSFSQTEGDWSGASLEQHVQALTHMLQISARALSREEQKACAHICSHSGLLPAISVMK